MESPKRPWHRKIFDAIFPASRAKIQRTELHILEALEKQNRALRNELAAMKKEILQTTKDFQKNIEETHTNLQRNLFEIALTQKLEKASQIAPIAGTPKVSVIVPVYNVEKYLAESLDSVCGQTLHDLEIICVNDGSTDRSREILEEYRSRDVRIKIIDQANAGLSAARNAGLKIATGTYVYFLDSDDKIVPDALEKLFAIASADDLEIVYFGGNAFYETAELENTKSHYKKYYKINYFCPQICSGFEILEYLLKQKNSFVATAQVKFWSRKFLQKNKLEFANGTIHEDELFAAKAFPLAQRVLIVPAEYFLRRVRPSSIMTTKPTFKNFEGYYLAALEFKKLAETNPGNREVYTAYFQKRISGMLRFYQEISESDKLLAQKLMEKIPLGDFPTFTKFVKQLSAETITIFEVPEHGNIGDHAILIAEHEFFKKYFPEKSIIDIPAGAFVPEKKEEFAQFFKNSILTIIGGGNLGNLWIHHELTYREIFKAFPQKQITIFPQTMLFEQTGDWQTELSRSREAYSAHKNLHVFIRDKSIDFMRAEIMQTARERVYSVPDIVLSLDRSEPKFERAGALLVFRQDKEKSVDAGALEQIEKLLREHEIPPRFTDMICPTGISEFTREAAVEEKFNEFRRSRVVITDRLHGMIFATITGTPCVALNNSSGKVEDVWNLWLRENCPYIQFAPTLDDVPALLDKVLQLPFPQRYNPAIFEKHWQKIADVIRGNAK